MAVIEYFSTYAIDGQQIYIEAAALSVIRETTDPGVTRLDPLGSNPIFVKATYDEIMAQVIALTGPVFGEFIEVSTNGRISFHIQETPIPSVKPIGSDKLEINIIIGQVIQVFGNVDEFNTLTGGALFG